MLFCELTPLPAQLPFSELFSLKDMALQVPCLLVLVAVVWMFLAFMEKQRKDYTTLITRLHEEHVDARESTREVLVKNFNAMTEITKAIYVLIELTRNSGRAQP